MVIRRRNDPEPARVYASYQRKGGGRTHLMPVTLWASEVIAPTSRTASAYIIPLMVHTGPFGEPVSLEIAESRCVRVETER